MPKIFSKWLLLLMSLHGCALIAQSNCIDLSDLNAPFIHCTYGAYGNPYAHEGVLPGRHTVITEHAGDPTIGGFWYYGSFRYLDMIPPGETYSVRLGNNSGGSQAESIAVDITIDTNLFDLLILKYAVVLQNPSGHAPSERPRFRFEVLDSLNNFIDTLCLSVDFVADTSLGWNVAGWGHINLWKDWTNVGFDVSTFQNQTICIRLTTFDCGIFEHFGYAYFLLKCASKRIDVDVCGDVDKYSYSAPDGFNYNWFWRDDPDHSISHGRTVRVPAGGGRELGCHMSFTENPSCGFDLYTKTVRRFPLAGGRALQTDCMNDIVFVNESFVSNDGIHPDGTGNHCANAHWDFGDGHASDEFEPTHTYSSPGNYTVTMVAGMNGFECADTSYLEIRIPEHKLIDTVTCEPFIWAGNVYQESGEYHKSFPTASGCDSLVTLRLDANYNPGFTIHGDHWPIGGTELAWTQYTYNLVFDNPYCSTDSIVWSVDNPAMLVFPAADGRSCELRIFSFLPSNDSVPLRAVAYNRCGTEERTLWIHTSFYGVDDHPANAMDFSVFPNPNSGCLNIHMKGMAGQTRVELYDHQGSIVDSWIHGNKSDDETFAYDASKLCDGLYVIRITYDNRSLIHKVVVRK